MKPWLWLLLLGTLVMPAFPDNLQWERIGPVAGTVQRILPDRGHPGVFYLLKENYKTYDSELYRSTDNGESWEHSLAGDVDLVVVHPASSEVYVVRSGRGCGRLDLLSSTDQGRSFQLRCGRAPNKIFGHPTNPNILWGAGLSYGDSDLSISYDRGAHWKTFNNLPFKDGREYVVNGIKTWLDTYALRSVLVSPFDPGTVYVSTSAIFAIGCGDTRIPMELYSTNEGKTWTSGRSFSDYFYDPAFPDRAFSVASDMVRYLAPSGWKRFTAPGLDSIAVVPNRPNTFCGSSAQNWIIPPKQWFTHDGGAHWRPVDVGPGGMARVIVARSSPANTFLVGTSGGGLYITDINGSWRQVTRGLDDARITQVASAPRSDTVFAVASDNDDFLFRSLDAGRTWRNISDLLPPRRQARYRDIRLKVDPWNPRHVFAALDERILVSFDAGEAWCDVPLKGYASAFFGANPGIVYLSKWLHNRLFRSDDGGRTLQELPAKVGNSQNSPVDLAVDPWNGNLLIATYNGLYISNDGGQSAALVRVGQGQDHSDILFFDQVLALPVKGQYLAVSRQGIYKSLNHGATWKKLTSDYGKVYLADDRGKHLYRESMNGGLLESYDGGNNWDRVNLSLRWYAMTDPRYRPLFLATSIGLYRAKE